MTSAPAHRSRLRSPLARRLILGVVLFSIATTLVLSAIQLYLDYRVNLDDIEARLEEIEKGQLRALTQSLWATNANDLALQLEGIAHPSNIEYAAVHDGQRLWAVAGKRVSQKVIERHYPMRYAHRGNPVQVGTLTIVAGLDSVYRELLSDVVAVLARTAIRTFLVAGFILVFFHQLVSRHLFTITAYLRTLNPGSAPAPLMLARTPRRAPDEFDELTTAINTMREKTHSTLAALRDSEQRFHAIADYTPDWESWMSPDGRPR